MIESYYETKLGKLYHGDCLDIMKDIPDKSIDMILCDLPYGTTSCSWDVIIPFDKMWEQYERIVKDKSPIVLTASQPFTSLLVHSRLDFFKHEWIWQKSAGSNFAALKYQPMKEHESVLVFCKNSPNYFPIMEKRKGSGASRVKYSQKTSKRGEVYGSSEYTGWEGGYYDADSRYPSSIQFFNNREITRGLHPTQKPVDLFSYLIKTYTKEGDIILDNCAGSGTTGVSAETLKRRYILIEKEDKYCQIIKDRISETRREMLTFGE